MLGGWGNNAANSLLESAVFSLLIGEFATLMAAEILRVGWSCLTFAAFPTRPFNSASILVMLRMKWH